MLLYSTGFVYYNVVGYMHDNVLGCVLSHTKLIHYRRECHRYTAFLIFAWNEMRNTVVNKDDDIVIDNNDNKNITIKNNDKQIHNWSRHFGMNCSPIGWQMLINYYPYVWNTIYFNLDHCSGTVGPWVFTESFNTLVGFVIDP